MKAARFCQVGHPLVIKEVPQPQPGPGEVLVRVKACGIRGSDIHIVYEEGEIVSWGIGSRTGLRGADESRLRLR